jgi:hypothetical protein
MMARGARWATGHLASTARSHGACRAVPTTLPAVEDERDDQGMPMLNRDAIRLPVASAGRRLVAPGAAELPPSLAGLPPRSAPETKPTREPPGRLLTSHVAAVPPSDGMGSR